MAVFFYVLGSVVLLSMVSLVGVVSLSVGERRLQGFLVLLVAFASGSLLAAAFMHIIPEAFGVLGGRASTLVLSGIILFFLIEKFIHWHHCGKDECSVHPVAYLNLVGDALHNFIDGVIIAAAYLTSVKAGMATTAAIALHEIPQEFGDFSILLHSGMKAKKALLYNFLSALTAVFGAIAGFLFLSRIESLIPQALAVAAGGFIYIATADLMPELHKETNPGKLVQQTIALLAGVLALSAAFTAVNG